MKALIEFKDVHAEVWRLATEYVVDRHGDWYERNFAGHIDGVPVGASYDYGPNNSSGICTLAAPAVRWMTSAGNDLEIALRRDTDGYGVVTVRADGRRSRLAAELAHLRALMAHGPAAPNETIVEYVTEAPHWQYWETLEDHAPRDREPIDDDNAEAVLALVRARQEDEAAWRAAGLLYDGE